MLINVTHFSVWSGMRVGKINQYIYTCTSFDKHESGGTGTCVSSIDRTQRDALQIND